MGPNSSASTTARTPLLWLGALEQASFEEVRSKRWPEGLDKDFNRKRAESHAGGGAPREIPFGFAQGAP